MVDLAKLSGTNFEPLLNQGFEASKEGEKEIRLMDIALLHDHRSKGIGTALTQSILDEAAVSRRIVSLHVETENPAKRLYERLGFREVGEVTFYKRMHWAPEGLEQTSEKIAREAQAQVNTAS